LGSGRRVGFIGLGAMGSRMAKNIVKAGYMTTVYDIRRQAVEELVSLGAQPASSPRDVATRSDVILLSLPSSPHVEEVMLGPEGVLEGASPGLLVIDLSTIDPATTRKIYKEALKRGVRFIDAPVSGGTWGAETATLTIMVGAPDDETFNEAVEVLKHIGRTIVRVGGVGHGQVLKLANNAISAATLLATIEALVWVAKQGVDVGKAVEVIASSSGNSWQLRNRVPRILRRVFEPGFKTSLMLKDLGLFLKAASEANLYTPIISLAYQQIQLAMANGYSEEDYGSVVKVYERIAGEELRERGFEGAAEVSEKN